MKPESTHLPKQGRRPQLPATSRLWRARVRRSRNVSVRRHTSTEHSLQDQLESRSELTRRRHTWRSRFAVAAGSTHRYPQTHHDGNDDNHDQFSVHKPSLFGRASADV